MSKIAVLSYKAVLGLVVAVLAAGTVAPGIAQAGSFSQEQTPPNPPADFRIERIWARQRHAYDRMGFLFDHAEQRIHEAQNLIDQAKANGKDVADVQTALDAFSKAVQQARPVYESAKGLVAAHQGFDANGKVTDREKAVETVKAMSEKLKQVRSILGEPAKNLREAIRDFREANKAPKPGAAVPGGIDGS